MNGLSPRGHTSNIASQGWACIAAKVARSCPLWVKSGQSRTCKFCPLYPRKRTLRAYLSADHSRRYRRTGRALQLQWLHDERELKGPCLGEVLEDVDHATEVCVHRGRNGVTGRFP